MNVTERTIFEQFDLWRQAPHPTETADRAKTYAVVGCGTSYNLALSIAALLNGNGYDAVAVPGNEWVQRPGSYRARRAGTEVIAISRSGESTELVQAAEASRREGLGVIAITSDKRSSLVRHADRVIAASTHPEEGIVMTASASLMLLLGMRFAGLDIDAEEAAAASREMLIRLQGTGSSFLNGRSHFVYLGGGPLYGIAAEGALKLQEMSCSVTQTYHPLEYRHGPVSLIDRGSIIVLLYHPETREEEERLAAELRAKGAFIVGLGGAGDLELPSAAPAQARPLVYLPALQLLGEQMAQVRQLDTTAPRHLTKVVKIA